MILSEVLAAQSLPCVLSCPYKNTPKRQYENEVSWTTSTWLALQSQRLSVAVHIASAWEIATEMQLAGGGGEAPSSDEEGGATA